jgi:hypothetical protein
MNFYNAAPFNENENEPYNQPIQRKKTSHNRTQKKFDDQIIDQDKVNQVLKSMNSLQNVHKNSVSEDPSSLGELGDYFQSPPEKPISSGVQKTRDPKEAMSNLGTQPKPAEQYGDEQMELNNFQQNYGDVKSSQEYYKRFIPDFAKLAREGEDDDDHKHSGSAFGNYMKAPIVASKPGFSNSDVLLEKLNYMIHLLEEQHDERTQTVTEEVILYSFLGIFIIFIVDSFCRIGKYTR